MNIFKEYMQKKKELEPLRNSIIKHLQQYDLFSVETFLTLENIVKNPKGNTQRIVAQQTDLSINTISTIVLKLVEKGYITNEKDESDTSERLLKRKLLKPTERGIETYNELMKLFETTE